MKSIESLKAQIDNQQLRINTLEKLIEHQSDAYAEGYHQGLKDSGRALMDFSLSEMSDEYRINLYNRALKEFPAIKLT